MSDSDSAAFDREERVVAKGDASTELRSLEFPFRDLSCLEFTLLCFDRFLFPKLEAAPSLRISGFSLFLVS
jgi:hypothetical protein